MVQRSHWLPRWSGSATIRLMLVMLLVGTILALLPQRSLAATVPIANPGFETGSESGWLSGGADHGVNTVAPRSGIYALYNGGKWNSVFQNVSGLSSNTSYTLTAWARLASASSASSQSIYVSTNNGATRQRVLITSTSYTQYSLTFNTGTSTTVQFGSEETNGATLTAYLDDFVLSSGTTTPPPATPVPTATPTPPTSGSAVTRIRFFPRAGFASRMLNGRFTGSNESATNGFVELARIATQPADNAWTEITLSNATVYRYVKFESPAGGWGNVAEVEFYNGTTRLAGTGFGTAGSWNNSGNDYTRALDGNTSTFFDAASADNQYVGLDLGTAAQVATPTFNPAPGSYSSAQSVTINSATSGATIRYTTDGSTPSTTSGTVYGGPIAVGATTTIRAIAYKSGLASSAVASATYTIGSTPPPPPDSSRRVYHIGNSVTDTINYGAIRSMIQSTGRTYTYGRHIIPGAPLEWIWDHPADGFSESPFGLYSNALPNYTWDAVTLQPFDRLLPSDTTYGKRYIDLARNRAENSNTQFYVYSRWPRKNSDGSLDYDAKWLRTYTGGYDGTEETKDYFEDLVNSLRGQTAYLSKPVLMIPVGDVLYELNQRMKRGAIPGFSNVNQLYADGIHLNNVGAFVTASTFYSTIYKADPRGASYAAYDVVNNAATDRDITPELASALQQCVWDVVSQHPYAGLR